LDLTKNTALESLFCDKNEITSLDLSKNPELKKLYCNNNSLKNLDVTQNGKLETVQCQENQLLEDGLNALFNTLHENDVKRTKSIDIYKNPGAGACNKSIAEKKGWKVEL
jgi:Leucine-rich repeat (LRR) protein